MSKASPTPAPASPQKQRMPWEAEPGVSKSVPTVATRWHFGFRVLDSLHSPT